MLNGYINTVVLEVELEVEEVLHLIHLGILELS
jgi:hypothetical protein